MDKLSVDDKVEVSYFVAPLPLDRKPHNNIRWRRAIIIAVHLDWADVTYADGSNESVTYSRIRKVET